jgi:hypothetical protein
MKKKVNILLATFKPNFIFFKKLLQSLNQQTYSNITLTIRDDSDDIKFHQEIYHHVRENITSFEYKIYKNDVNLGSNKTFELLTNDADGEYIAYCDQDDIWENTKIKKLVETIENEDAVICYSDLSIIDKDDVIHAKSFKDIQKRLKHLHGTNLFDYFLRRNSITGCTMLIRSDVAKKAIPFCHKYYVHDHWLALFASTQGRVAYIREPLIRYRIHDNNQIGVSLLKGIKSIEDYLEKKLLNERKKYEYLLYNYEFNNSHREQIRKTKNWTEQRINFFRKLNLKNTFSMIKGLRVDWQLVLFEVIINFIPRRIVKGIFRIISK